ncbi:MAG: Mor transcription activator family protein [Clostridia bacterium]|nr:Mor transcription activator family protein [Clostridia bacterium]
MKCEIRDLNALYRDIAELIGKENAEILFREYRGQQITFPVKFYSKEYIYNCIKKEFDGSNIRVLARKYNYSERSVRRILKNNDEE